jgi:hypothetical protein
MANVSQIASAVKAGNVEAYKRFWDQQSFQAQVISSMKRGSGGTKIDMSRVPDVDDFNIALVTNTAGLQKALSTFDDSINKLAGKGIYRYELDIEPFLTVSSFGVPPKPYVRHPHPPAGPFPTVGRWTDPFIGTQRTQYRVPPPNPLTGAGLPALADWQLVETVHGWMLYFANQDQFDEETQGYLVDTGRPLQFF